jgi:hypothetical protein
VYSQRNTGTQTDYRDRASAISLNILFRIQTFGNRALRKVVSSIYMYFRGLMNSESTFAKVAVDGDTNFEDADSFKLHIRGTSDNLSDLSQVKTLSISISPPVRRAASFQLMLSNSGKDEVVEISGVEYRVAGLVSTSEEQAKKTT